MEKKDENRLRFNVLGRTFMLDCLSGSCSFAKKIRYVIRLTNRKICALQNVIVNHFPPFHIHSVSFPFEVLNSAAKPAFRSDRQSEMLTKRLLMPSGFNGFHICNPSENVQLVLDSYGS